MSSRFVTLTLNPTVDIACDAPAVRTVHKVRMFGETYDAGGGGVNVARVLREMEPDVVAVLTVGDVTGRLLEERLSASMLPYHAVPIHGRTRISMTVHDLAANEEYRFVSEGPMLSEAEWQAALKAVTEIDAEWVIASGSLPRGVPEDFYAQLARLAAKRGQQMVLDTSGPALRAAMGEHLAVIKPSLSEFEFLIGRPLDDPAAQAAAAQSIVQSGSAACVAVTLGEAGALIATREGVWRLPAMDVPVRGTVGAGDSFVAALVASLARGDSPATALAWGTAGGAAAVMNSGTAHPTRAEIEALFRRAHAAPVKV
jgi:6-phosphofructokinase 2